MTSPNLDRPVVYFGTGEFAVQPLLAIAEKVSLVVSQPDRPKGRGGKLAPSAVKIAAILLGIEVATPEKARSPEFLEELRAKQPELLVVASYGQILSQKLLEIAPLGGVNLHGSILPKFRGAAPIQRAILEGERKTGINLMQMDKGMDTGDLIDLVTTEIGEDETYGELQQRLSQLASGQISEWLPKLLQGGYAREPQDHSLATHAAKLEKSDGELCVTRLAEQEYRRFKAVTPNPGATLATKYGRLKLTELRLSDVETDGQPGEILQVKGGLVIAFAEGAILFKKFQPEGKPAMDGQAFANGRGLKIGDQLCL